MQAGGLMTIDGNGTTIHHNGTHGGGYGLYTWDSSCSIHLVSPLTKEMISTNTIMDMEITVVQFKQLRTTTPRKKI